MFIKGIFIKKIILFMLCIVMVFISSPMIIKAFFYYDFRNTYLVTKGLVPVYDYWPHVDRKHNILFFLDSGEEAKISDLTYKGLLKTKIYTRNGKTGFVGCGDYDLIDKKTNRIRFSGYTCYPDYILKHLD